jgi:hypothetical protein
MGTQESATLTARNIVQRTVNGEILNGRTTAVLLAAGLRQFAVHMNKSLRTRAFMKVIDILRAEEEPVANARF